MGLDDDYYDDELDEEEALEYQKMMAMQGKDPMAGAQQLLGQGFEIMEEELDEDYEPNSEEIEEYAKYLGMEINQDKDLFYIAKEGLKAPLPGPWKPCKSPGENIYYFNFETQELQKEHPCDDYYRKYYLNEKSNHRRKKEEKVIKKQIKQQQKQQQQVMPTSLSASAQHANQSNQQVNSSLQQMLLMNMSGLDASTSVINERVQIELEQVMEEYDEQKIVHERQKREELKKLDLDKNIQKQQLQENAKSQVKSMTDRIKRQKESDKTGSIVKRRAELQLQKDRRLQELRDQERKGLLQQQSHFRDRIDKLKTGQKKEEEHTHQLEISTIKSVYRQKVDLDRERIKEESKALIEESGDIDRQVRRFRQEFLEDKIDAQRDEIDDEYRQRLNQIKQENKSKVEKDKSRVEQAYNDKLEREREKEQKKVNSQFKRIEEQKDAMKKESQNRVREEKRKLERANTDKIRSIRDQFEDDLDQAKADVKRQVQAQFDLKDVKAEKDFERFRQDLKDQLKAYEKMELSHSEQEKRKIELQHEREWQEEQTSYHKSENEGSESYQAIIKEIQGLRNKHKEHQQKKKKLEKDLIRREGDIDDLEAEKRTKERESRENTKSPIKGQKDEHEIQLELDLREKEEELARLKDMIREKQLQSSPRGIFSEKEGSIRDGGSSSEYKKLSKEVDTIKLLLLDLKSQKVIDSNSKVSFSYNAKKRSPIQIDDYSLSEIQAMLELELPKTKHNREKYDNERALMRQLLSNIERNRAKLRKEFFDAGTLSHQRKLAISGVKDKIDDQARILQEEVTAMKDKCDYYRRKEDKLRMMKQKIDIVTKIEDDESDQRDAHLKDLQVDYDKYLKLYQQDQDKIGKSRVSKSAIRQSDQHQFETKWAGYLIEEADKDLKPMIGLDPDRALFKPRSLYQKYELSNSHFKSKIGFNHIYENEVHRVKQQRVQMHTFLNDQQKWLSKMRSEVSHANLNVPKSVMHHAGSSESLFQLKNNLSHILINY